MKKTIFYSIIAFICLSFGACTSIDEDTDGRLDYEDVWNEPKRVAGYLNYCYEGIRQSRLDNFSGLTMLATCCDEGHDVQDVTGGTASMWNKGALNPYYNPLASPEAWDMYSYIRRCNVFLANIESAAVMSERARQSYIGQAYGLRAYYYLQMIKNYGGVPLLLTDVSDKEVDYSSFERASFSECARQIISDCRKVIDNQFISWRSGNDETARYAFSKGMAYAIMSEVALYAASPLNNDGSLDWNEAAEITKEALTTLQKNGYALYKNSPNDGTSYTSYDLYFYSRSDVVGVEDKETIMEAPNHLATWAYHGLPFVDGQSRAGTCPSQELIDCYETISGVQPILGYKDAEHLQPIINPEATDYDENNPYVNRDPRLISSVYYNGVAAVPGGDVIVNTAEGGNCAVSASTVRNTRTGYYLRKFSNCKSDRNSNKDGYFKIFRLGELYLNYAEAANEAEVGPTAPNAAVDAVNEIRARVGMPAIAYGLSKDEFRKRVRNERRVELAFEEHRFYDVRRWKILNETDQVVTGMQPIENDGVVTSYKRFVVDFRSANTDKYLRFPLPGNEVLKLNKLTGKNFQNEGW